MTEPRIKAKCAYEHESWLGVYKNWPSLFASVPAVPPKEEKR